MKKFTVIAIILVMLAACKTTEANYRAAYEKTIAAREEADQEAAYGGQRPDMQFKSVVSGSDTIQVLVEQISYMANDKETAPAIAAYNVAAGRFKQLFNARSLCKRLIDAGYKDAIVVKTAEPYYYIIASSFSAPKEAKAALQELKAAAPVTMNAPFPLILNDPRKK